MEDNVEKNKGGILGEELLRELKGFLLDKPGGYQFNTRFVRDAVREKMARMKEAEGKQ